MTYQNKKDAARNSIINLCDYMNERPLSYGELAIFQDTIKRIGRKYGLLRELRENGII